METKGKEREMLEITVNMKIKGDISSSFFMS